MSITRRHIALAGLALVAAGAAAWFIMGGGEQISFEAIKRQRTRFREYVDAHYIEAVLIFLGVYASTAFFVPGALALTLVAGFLFGVAAGASYVVVSSTAGAVVAFLLARYAFRDIVRNRYEDKLDWLNRELGSHGHNYLIFLRIVPVMPFFAVNYLAGLTGMKLSTFTWATAAGMLPGSIIYAFAGRQLGNIEKASEVASPGVIGSIAAMGIFVMLPVIRSLIRKMRNKS